MYERDNGPKERTAEQALTVLQWLCAKMERCESDVRRSLYRWKVPREEWDEVVEKLRQGGYVDNERYASAYVREKSRLSGWGKAKIVSGLRAKGIDRELVQSVVEEYVDRDEEREKLEQFVIKRIERDRERSKSLYDLRSRVFRAAASRGYDFDAINDLLNQYCAEWDEQD